MFSYIDFSCLQKITLLLIKIMIKNKNLLYQLYQCIKDLNPYLRRGGAIIIPCRKYRDFSRTEHPIDMRPVCKFKFVRWGPVETNQSALSVSVQSWRPDEFQKRHFPNSKIEIFTDFWPKCRFLIIFSGVQFKSQRPTFFLFYLFLYRSQPL